MMDALTTNKSVLSWIEDKVNLVKPDKIVWIDGSKEQIEALRAEACSTGEMIKLNEEKLPDCYLHRTAVNDVARVEARTLICSKKEEDAVVDDLLAEVSQPKRDFSEEEIIARMMIPMVNEVVRCLEESIIATPAEADMALVYGLGFPPFHGGAFRWLDTLGSAKYLDMAQQYQHLGPLYEVPEGLRNKARHNEPYYPPVEPARPVGDLKTA